MPVTVCCQNIESNRHARETALVTGLEEDDCEDGQNVWDHLPQ
jgi:hypothetical protein